MAMLCDLSQLSDEELMKKYQEGSETAFTVLYQRHSAKVYGFLLGKLRDRAVADDLFQATFLKVHQFRHKYDVTSPFTPWLFTVCRNAMIDGIRQKKRSSQWIDEGVDSVRIEAAMAPETPDQPSIPSFDDLPVGQRQVLQLRYGSELSFDEIAQALETTPANVRQLASRAVRKLRDLMGRSDG